jgi:hypothetical protein
MVIEGQRAARARKLRALHTDGLLVLARQAAAEVLSTGTCGTVAGAAPFGDVNGAFLAR